MLFFCVYSTNHFFLMMFAIFSFWTYETRLNFLSLLLLLCNLLYACYFTYKKLVCLNQVSNHGIFGNCFRYEGDCLQNILFNRWIKSKHGWADIYLLNIHVRS